MRKTILPVSAVLLLSVLVFGLIGDDSEPALNTEAEVKDPLVTKEIAPLPKLSLEEQLVHKILLQDNNEALSQSYGNTLLMVDREFRQLTTETHPKTGKQRNILRKESRAYFPLAYIEKDMLWADQLSGQGFLQEAYYHYWMLEQSLAKSKDPRLAEIQKKRKKCEGSISFFPKETLSAKEKLDNKRIVFFLSEEKNGLVEIDPQGYGIPKALEEKFFAAVKAEGKKDWQKARDLFANVVKQLSPKSAAYNEVLWKLVRLDHKLGSVNANRVLELVKAALKFRPDIRCDRLTKAVRSKYQRDYAKSLDDLPETIEYVTVVDERGYWKGRAFAVHSLAPFTSKWLHMALPKRTHYNYRNALRMKQKRVLKALEGMLPKLTTETVDRWRLLGNQYVRVGDFRSASLVFLKLETLTKDSRDAFKSMACQIRSSVEQESAQPALRIALLEQFKIYHPGVFQNSLIYLEGQIAFQAREWEKARKLFGTLLAKKEGPETRGSEFYCSILDREILRLHIPQSLSETGVIKVNVTRRNLQEIHFRFLKVKDALVLRETSKLRVTQQISEFFANQKSKALECVGEKVQSFAKLNYGEVQSSELSLQLPGEGAWVVEAVAGALKTKFIAVYQSAKAFGFQFPESSLIVFEGKNARSVSELAVYSQKGRYLGKTDEKGALVTSLAPDYGGSKDGLATVYCSKPGHTFKTSVKLSKRVRDKGVPRAPTKLYVYTDRPLYEAGDTLRFKGVIRHDKVPSIRSPEGRYSVATGEEVKVLVKQKERIIFSKSLVSNEFGSFHGSYQFPKQAARKKYTVEVHYKKVVAKASIELRDLNKPSYSIHFAAKETGFRVFAGYSWGVPVPGAELECFVGKKLVAVSFDKDGFGFLKLNAGDKVTIGLKKGKEVLLVKSRTFSAPKKFFAPRPARKSADKASETGKNRERRAVKAKALVAKSKPEFQVSLEQSFDPKTGAIVLKLTSKSKKPWLAWIALGDTAAFDYRRIHSKGESKLVTLPVTRACDPCVYAHVQFERGKLIQKEQLRIPVRAALLQVEVETDRELYKPGETVRFDLWAKGLSGVGMAAEASLAVVDEVIFSLKDDETPDIYDFFYSDRGTDCHFEKFSVPSFRAQDVFAQGELKLAHS
ncbi:MAG: MG2 domain-containing protein, partial [Planctomycetota bacterium]|nr:MG2 domain-containing protein [Planctomycetota bacterium]